MIRGALLWLAAAGGALAQAAEAVAVPSGRAVFFQEMIWNQPGAGLVYRFRFVSPGLGQDQELDFEVIEADMAHLCTTYALPRVATTGPRPAQIIISLADRELTFGEANPEAKQFFEAYRIEDGSCTWDIF